MNKVIKQRMTVTMKKPFVVFLIGMRFNVWWKLHKWLPVVLAMPRMLKELSRQKSDGLLSYEMWFGRTTLMVQYWDSFESLEKYAKAKERAHLPAWQAFNQKVGSGGDVGIWHETYQVSPDAYESIYNNMPKFGLGRAGVLVEASGDRNRAEGRLKNP